MKLDEAIYFATKKLQSNGIKSALLDSEILLSKAINKDRKFIILNLDNDINEKDHDFYKRLIYQRSKGRPIAYLTGKKSFWNFEFEINENVLIPRPDTEIIVEQVLNLYKNKNRINFLDIGFGSGCILLSILKERKDFKATGIDLSDHAIKICSVNAHKLSVKNRVRLFKTNIDKFSLGKYD